MKPSWLRRKLRLWVLGCCPWCGTRLERGVAGFLFLHGVRRCPNGHYAEEDVMGAGTLVYENEGKDMRSPSVLPESPRPGVVIDISSKGPKGPLLH